MSDNLTNPEAGNIYVTSDSGIFMANTHTPPPNTIIKGDIKMADIVTGTVTGLVNNLPETTLKEVSDARREQASQAGSIQLESMKGFDRVNADVQRAELNGVSATKDARYDVITHIDAAQDRVVSQTDKQYHASEGRQVDILRDIARVQATADLNREVYSAGAEKAMLQNQVEALKNTQFLSEKIGNEGDRTRALINDLKYHDLNRHLVERNAELVELANDRWRWRDEAFQNQFQGQWASLQTQLQAFASQLQDTKQGITNFGSMRGVGQSSTSNNA